jgi:cytochrome c oxidase accessory protein FixG
MGSKIYPQRFPGKYRTIKDITAAFLLFIYMVVPWITYERGFNLPNQAIMIDLPNRKAYIFNVIIWPEELYYLTLILILAAVGLFICTSLFGRIWCGYTCPHTTMVDIFTLVERLIEGDRNARMRLDDMEMNLEKFTKKSLTHIIWIVISFLFGFGWVGYFYDVRLLTRDLLNFSVTSNGLIWLVALTGTTYLFGGFLRERVCTHICPYGRFQSGLVDENTIIVTYHSWRGEPRGKDSSAGDCIDCNRCVIACPMGIDIRDGLQMSCIGCGLCIDACNSVMDKMNRPRDLIEYTSASGTRLLERSGIKKSIFTPKVIFYSSVFSIATSILVASLIMKSPFIFSIDKINSPLFTVVPDGSVRNSYRLNIVNKTAVVQKDFCLYVTGIDGLLINVQSFTSDYREKFCFDLNPGAAISSQVFVKLSREKLNSSHYKKITFELSDGNSSITTDGLFYINR